MKQSSFLNQLDWRFATKSFDPSKPLEEKKLASIMEAIRMTPTSYGLQTFHCFLVTNPSVKKKLKSAAFQQSQLIDAPVTIVFCADTNIKKRITDYIELASGGNSVQKLKMKPYQLIMSQSVGKLKEEEAYQWSAKQAYIALGFAMAACAELEVDSCPMEGFLKEKVDKILALPESMRSVLLLPIGYRLEGPKRKKIRFSNEDLFTQLG